jgi:hypothetical protein
MRSRKVRVAAAVALVAGLSFLGSYLLYLSNEKAKSDPELSKLALAGFGGAMGFGIVAAVCLLGQREQDGQNTRMITQALTQAQPLLATQPLIINAAPEAPPTDTARVQINNEIGNDSVFIEMPSSPTYR